MRYNLFVHNKTLTEQQYQALANLRYVIRKFLHFSESAARQAGVEPQQHQLMLAIKGLPEGAKPTIGEIAERLQVQHNTAVELVNRAEAAGYVRRMKDRDDKRQVLVWLTDQGERVLDMLSAIHMSELKVMGPQLIQALESIVKEDMYSK
ncbi:transcriptional regulator, MarR family [Thermobaculum terrenum ATCC BAA-798]|uniref:Transcriptional regulator, MarR family n=1 Tax=Thermobaculum terrenum (strain ATCC BAA-798 / CCMEE 7001 / YNP1) TaxID=525904 RepID=D1CB34_THET1|nr:transcriptional regulator, MarR family [Thermobaculum terrenum ATCC BAA-798]